MATYSTKLCAFNTTATGLYDCFTAASDVTTIIRDISGVNNDTAAALGAYLLINGVGYQYFATGAGPANFHEELRIVLAPGDVVEWFEVSGFGSIAISGYVLQP